VNNTVQNKYVSKIYLPSNFIQKCYGFLIALLMTNLFCYKKLVYVILLRYVVYYLNICKRNVWLFLILTFIKFII
jgi:hypothetical protein